MQARGIILANETRLMREMLRRAIGKAPGLCVAGEAVDPAQLPAMVEETGAQWVVTTLRADGRLPEAVEALSRGRPSLRVLAVSSDGGRAVVRGAGREDRVLVNLSLTDLIAILR